MPSRWARSHQSATERRRSRRTGSPNSLTGLGRWFSQLYGMAEVASIATMLRQDDHRKIVAGRTELTASAGRPSYLVDVRVVDDSGTDCAPGQRGEVLFQTPYSMRCYHRDPDRTAQTLVDGWVRSGDIGQWDDEGYLYIVDRKKDLIIRGGYNITPSEIENVLLPASLGDRGGGGWRARCRVG